MIKLKAIINQIELRNKVIALLTENDIDVSLLDIRALKSYGGDVRVYLTNVKDKIKKYHLGQLVKKKNKPMEVTDKRERKGGIL